MISLICILLAPARAADHELSLELGALGTADDRFDLFDDAALVGTLGLRGGYALHDRVSLLLGYHIGAWGQGVEDGSGFDETTTGYYYDEYDDGGGQELMHASYRMHLFSLGPKADLRVADWLYPYATVQGLLAPGTVRLDDDPKREDNLNQLRGGGLTGGGAAALGLDIIPLARRQAVRAGAHLEMGYGLLAARGYKGRVGVQDQKVELARFGMGGFYLRWGVGVYF